MFDVARAYSFEAAHDDKAFSDVFKCIPLQSG